MPEKIMAIDPGLHMGYALFVDGVNTRMGIVEGREVNDKPVWDALRQLITKEIDIWVCEDYKIRPVSKSGWQQTWESPYALQVIGAIKLITATTGAELVIQQPSILRVAAGMAGMTKWTKKNSKHNIDAMLHGIYYLRTRKK